MHLYALSYLLQFSVKLELIIEQEIPSIYFEPLLQFVWDIFRFKFSQLTATHRRELNRLKRYWHDVIMTWKHFCITGPLCGESTANQWIFLTKDQKCGALMFSLMYIWTNGWTGIGFAGIVIRYYALVTSRLWFNAHKIPYEGPIKYIRLTRNVRAALNIL